MRIRTTQKRDFEGDMIRLLSPRELGDKIEAYYKEKYGYNIEEDCDLQFVERFNLPVSTQFNGTCYLLFFCTRYRRNLFVNDEMKSTFYDGVKQVCKEKNIDLFSVVLSEKYSDMVAIYCSIPLDESVNRVIKAIKLTTSNLYKEKGLVNERVQLWTMQSFVWTFDLGYIFEESRAMFSNNHIENRMLSERLEKFVLNIKIKNRENDTLGYNLYTHY